MLLSVLYFLLFAITFYFSYVCVARIQAGQGVYRFEVALAALGWAAIIVFFYN